MGLRRDANNVTQETYDVAVCGGGHPIDVHKANSRAQSLTWLKEAYNIPYRASIPKGTNNLITAGRCISASREALGSIRVQATCMALGQAAGTAAALCCEKKLPVHELDGNELKWVLKEHGAIV